MMNKSQHNIDRCLYASQVHKLIKLGAQKSFTPELIKEIKNRRRISKRISPSNVKSYYISNKPRIGNDAVSFLVAVLKRELRILARLANSVFVASNKKTFTRDMLSVTIEKHPIFRKFADEFTNNPRITILSISPIISYFKLISQISRVSKDVKYLLIMILEEYIKKIGMMVGELAYLAKRTSISQKDIKLVQTKCM